MKTENTAPKKPSLSRILRSVASSTAIETGQPIKQIEATLASGKSKFQHLTLAS